MYVYKHEGQECYNYNNQESKGREVLSGLASKKSFSNQTVQE